MMKVLRRVAFGLSLLAITSAEPLPAPKVGLLIPKGKVVEVRKQMDALKNRSALEKIIARAEKTHEEWPKLKLEIEPHIAKGLDLLYQGNPRDHVSGEAIEAIKKLNKVVYSTANLGFHYLMTGEEKYATTAYEIIAMCGRLPRWGWFNWDGANLPQIHYGFMSRTIAFSVDFCWSGWTEQQRKEVIEQVARKSVESYWRLVSLTPFMGLHHLRSKNQGNNAIAGALIASIVVGDEVPENEIWFDSLLHSYAWLIAHDIGWAGQGLESGLPGYWSVSMQNLYTAAACLNNAVGIDLRSHPGIAEATWYPVYHEATVPSGVSPYKGDIAGKSSLIGGKPIAMPGKAYGAAWWRDFARHFPDSPANYFAALSGNQVAHAHQTGHEDLIRLLWVDLYEQPTRTSVAPPAELFKTTDRMTMFRSGYGAPHTYFYFNGDFFLSARGEILRASSGMSWHWKWHQFAVAESVLQTEGELLSPSMLVKDMFNSDFVSMIHTVSGHSNVAYYKLPGHDECWKNYKVRDRDIAYVRSPDIDKTYDYFVFIDKVEHTDERWHGVNWHIWNSPESPGHYEFPESNMAIGRRPNADILLVTLSHDKVAYEEEGVSVQPHVSYQDDHDAQLLRAVLGGYESTNERPVEIPSSRWSEGDNLKVDGRNAMHMIDFKLKTPTLRVPITLTPGMRYRVSIDAKKKKAPVYENTAWGINLLLINKDGRVISAPNVVIANTSYPADVTFQNNRTPHPLRLTDPQSVKSDTDWRTISNHFDAPEGVAFIEARFNAADYSHPPRKLTPESEVWLSDITITPLGRPHRTSKDLAVTLAMPLPKNSDVPQIKVKRSKKGITADIQHPDGTLDTVVIGPDGKPTITRKARNTGQVFAWHTRELRVGRKKVGASSPIHAAFKTSDGMTSGKVSLSEKAEVKIAGEVHALGSGSHIYDGKFQPDTSEASLSANSTDNQKVLAKGVATWMAKHHTARDKYTKQGWVNIALNAGVTATSTRDARFSPTNVIDNKVCEFPFDGRLDYTQGDLETTQSGGYSATEHMSYLSKRSTWPFYVRPSYWLLPPRQLGEIAIRLRKPARLKMVRILNTTNGGLNDFAAVGFHVDLLPATGFPMWTAGRQFGKPWDRAFEDAFAMPKFFSRYGPSFEGVLERGTIVPFGAGWVDIPIQLEEPVHAVRITVDSFWAAGGGLNEVQIY